jgi:primase-polymerase (primpol)-like protein
MPTRAKLAGKVAQKRPRALAVIFDNIPIELQERPRWLLWRYWWDEGKNTWNKPPYSPRTGRKVSTQDSSEWATFREVRAAYRNGGWDGIGFVMGDGIAGADPDHCITGDQLTEQAAAIVDRLDTYTERSPSGNGLRVLAVCSQPFRDTKSPALELYNTAARYLTITGQHLAGTPGHLQERTAEFHELHREYFPPAAPKPTPEPRQEPAAAVDLSDDDAALLERARNNPTTGARFASLYDRGDLSGNDGDHSAADLALCNSLAYWTNGDRGAIDRLYRESALYRAKWDAPHRADGATYGQMTIEKALDGLQGGYQPRKVDAASALDVRTLEARLEAMEARLAEYEAENARLRQFVSNTEKILTADKFEGWQTTTKMVELYTQLELFKRGEGAAIDRGASSIAEAVGISVSTASTHLKRLQEAGLIHWSTEANLYDQRRLLVDKREAPDRPDPLHWETESRVIPLPLLDDLPALERTEYDEKQVDKAEQNRKRLKLAEAILEKVVCPCCGVLGEVHASCQACGEVFTREHDAVRGALGLDFELQNRDDWPGFEVQNAPETEPEPPVLKFKTREATPGFELQNQAALPKIETIRAVTPKIESTPEPTTERLPTIPTVGWVDRACPPTVESVGSRLPAHLAECPLEPLEPPPDDYATTFDYEPGFVEVEAPEPTGDSVSPVETGDSVSPVSPAIAGQIRTKLAERDTKAARVLLKRIQDPQESARLSEEIAAQEWAAVQALCAGAGSGAAR